MVPGGLFLAARSGFVRGSPCAGQHGDYFICGSLETYPAIYPAAGKPGSLPHVMECGVPEGCRTRANCGSGVRASRRLSLGDGSETSELRFSPDDARRIRLAQRGSNRLRNSSNPVLLRTCDSLESGPVNCCCHSTAAVRLERAVKAPRRPPTHGRISTRGRGLPTPRTGLSTGIGVEPMTTDPLQQLLDDVSLAMNYARAGLVDYGYRLLIERCVHSDARPVDTRSRYHSVIQSFERRWKIRYH
jgi:hypothetical protein